MAGVAASRPAATPWKRSTPTGASVPVDDRVHRWSRPRGAGDAARQRASRAALVTPPGSALAGDRGSGRPAAAWTRPGQRRAPGQQVAELVVDVVDQAAEERERVARPATPSGRPGPAPRWPSRRCARARPGRAARRTRGPACCVSNTQRQKPAGRSALARSSSARADARARRCRARRTGRRASRRSRRRSRPGPRRPSSATHDVRGRRGPSRAPSRGPRRRVDARRHRGTAAARDREVEVGERRAGRPAPAGRSTTRPVSGHRG